MAIIYLGNQLMSEYLGNLDITIIARKEPLFPLQYWVVQPCGGGSESSLAIDVDTTLTVGLAIRPVIEPGTTTPLAGYEIPICWTLISTTTSGTYCGIRAPAANCSQSVCL